MFSFKNNSDRETIRRAARVVLAVADGDFEQRIIGISDDPEVAEFENAIDKLTANTPSPGISLDLYLLYRNSNSFMRMLRIRKPQSKNARL